MKRYIAKLTYVHKSMATDIDVPDVIGTNEIRFKAQTPLKAIRCGKKICKDEGADSVVVTDLEGNEVKEDG